MTDIALLSLFMVTVIVAVNSFKANMYTAEKLIGP